MIESLGGLGALLRLAQQAPTAARIARAVDLVRRGRTDENAGAFDEALSYLRQDGLYDGLDLARPGAGEIGRQVTQQAVDAIGQIRATIRGDWAEYHEVEGTGARVPWGGFVRRLERQRFGGHVLLGQPGMGKTQLAKRLAYRWMKRLGRPVEFFGAYPEDLPDWGTSMGMRTLVHRMEKLQAYLDAHEGRDPDEETEKDEPALRQEPSLPPTERVIVIDESSMSMTTSAHDPRRNAVIRSLANCRHVDWTVAVIAQMSGLIALPLLGQTTVWVKKPSGAELDTDRDNPMVRRLWQRAMEAFSRVKENPYWYQYPDVRAWSYVESPSVGGEPGYQGLVPNGMAPDYDEETQEDA